MSWKISLQSVCGFCESVSYLFRRVFLYVSIYLFILLHHDASNHLSLHHHVHISKMFVCVSYPNTLFCYLKYGQFWKLVFYKHYARFLFLYFIFRFLRFYFTLNSSHLQFCLNIFLCSFFLLFLSGKYIFIKFKKRHLAVLILILRLLFILVWYYFINCKTVTLLLLLFIFSSRRSR